MTSELSYFFVATGQFNRVLVPKWHETKPVITQLFAFFSIPDLALSWAQDLGLIWIRDKLTLLPHTFQTRFRNELCLSRSILTSVNLPRVIMIHNSIYLFGGKTCGFSPLVTGVPTYSINLKHVPRNVFCGMQCESLSEFVRPRTPLNFIRGYISNN